MTPSQLRSRQVFIKASKLKSRVSIKKFTRRGENKIDGRQDPHPNDQFDTFFDFEKELSDLTPSSQQYIAMESKTIMEPISEAESNSYTENKYITLEEKSRDNYSIMEEIESPVTSKAVTVNANQDIELSDKRCCYVKKDGERCKKSYISKSKFCKIHKKIMDKQ